MYKRILIINPFGIGDVLFTTPLIHAIKDAFPGVEIGYLCNRRSYPVLKENPYLDYFFIYERDEFAASRKKSFFAWLKSLRVFINGIKAKQFDAALDFSLNTQYGFFSWRAGIKERIGYDYKRRGRFLTKRLKLSGYQEKHIVEYYAGLLEFLGISLKYRNLEFFLNEEDQKRINGLLAKDNIKEDDLLVGIIPGAGKSWGKDAYLKHWPAENFAHLADKIVENYSAKIIIMGDFCEKETAKKAIGMMKYRPLDFSGSTSLGELAALIGRMRLVIANDGGPLHLAAALGKKTVSFFGPVDPKVYGPYPADEKRHIVLRKNLECSPCYRNFRLRPCRRNKECLAAISVQEALEAVRGIL